MSNNTIFLDPFYPNEDLEDCEVSFLKPNQVKIGDIIVHDGSKTSVCTGVFGKFDVAVKEYKGFRPAMSI